MYILYIRNEREAKHQRRRVLWVLRAMWKNVVFCVFEGTRKSTKKKGRGLGERRRGPFFSKTREKRASKTHQKTALLTH
jgi:hypothetical protein